MTTENHRSIREYGVLFRGGIHVGIDKQSLLEIDWDWLHDQAPRFADESGEFLKPVYRDRNYALQVSNYVGVIQMPSGEVLEILPKISEVDTIEECRTSLFRMLCRVHQLPFKQSNDASLSAFNRPLLEILIGQFLSAAQQVINRGLRFDYRLIEEDSTYLRGKLSVQQYAQYPANKILSFPVQYDEYGSNRPENRLLHFAVRTVFHWSKDNRHRTHARKIMTLLSGIPPSPDPYADRHQWSTQRLMRHYRPVKPWIDLILDEQTPLSQKGTHPGVSMLFPMETLFERYVAEILKHQLPDGYSLTYDREGGKLAKYRDKYLVSLRPDFQIQYENQTISVLDAKWKRLEMGESNSGKVKNLSRTDLYQLFAYAMKILPNGGNLFLIYPKSSEFSEPMSDIELSDRHKLSAVPFDLLTGAVHCELFP
jgi:5-methylcytosine-specific restriction enzyme subunit McrC